LVYNHMPSCYITRKKYRLQQLLPPQFGTCEFVMVHQPCGIGCFVTVQKTIVLTSNSR